MSGGTFEYDQYKIRNIRESIQTELDGMGRKKQEDELWYDKGYYEKHPDEKVNTTHSNTTHSNAVIKIFKDGIKHLRLAEIYAQRIDWFLAGDDGEESLISRLKKDINSANF